MVDTSSGKEPIEFNYNAGLTGWRCVRIRYKIGTHRLPQVRSKPIVQPMVSIIQAIATICFRLSCDDDCIKMPTVHYGIL